MGTADPLEEARQLREELDRLRALVEALENADLSGSVTVSGVIVRGPGFPSAGAVGMTYQASAADVEGAEAEGEAGVVSTRPGVVFAVCLSDALPADGQEVLLHHTGTSWVFLV